jgi:hypothetical protein
MDSFVDGGNGKVALMRLHTLIPKHHAQPKQVFVVLDRLLQLQ